MSELRSEQDVKRVLRAVFADAVGLADSTVITDESLLYDPPRPPGDLGIAPPPAPAMASLLTLAMRQLVGEKIARQFATFLLPPDYWLYLKFGPIAAAVHARVNNLARRAATLAICDALLANPDTVFPDTRIRHPNEPGAFDFANRLQQALTNRMCSRPIGFSPAQVQQVVASTTVEKLVGVVVDILAKATCL